MIHIRKTIILFMLAIVIMFSNNVFATDEFKETEKSEQFKKWENLSDEERQNSIQPQYQTITFKDSIKRSKYNYLLNVRETTLSNYYSLKEDNIDIKVKDQKRTGACWAFSFTSALETTYQKKLDIDREYSPYHIELKTAKMFNRKIDDGGNALLGLAYAVSGNGPVLEENMPTSTVYDDSKNSYVSDVENLDLNKTVTGRVTGSKIFPNIYKTYSENSITYTDGLETTYSEDQVKSIRNLIKQFIKENGALSAYLYTDIGIDENGNYISDYYNPETYAYYCGDSTKTSNHAVTIVGWDDNFEVTNFKEGKRPINKGAYIVLNSYGSEFGKEGYMYVSYDDFAIENSLIGIEDLESDINYDKLYQYDELGANYNIATGQADLYAANIFTRDTSKQDMDELLNEVGIYLVQTEGVEIYLSKNGDLTDLEKVAAPGALEAGYHVVKLSAPQRLKNEKFAVVVKYTNTEGATIPLEANLYESNATFISTNIYSTASANEGESKYSLDGKTWNEINDTKVGYTVTLKNTNNCIKAYTTYQEKVKLESISLDKETLQMQVGDETNLVVTFNPSNTSYDDITWTSSNENVASISEKGIIKALSEGTTTITATSEYENKTATCELTVVKKTNTDDDIYKSDEKTDSTNKKDEITSKDKTTTKDETIAKDNLPNTGMRIMIIILTTGVVLIGVISFMKYKKYSDIK